MADGKSIMVEYLQVHGLPRLSGRLQTVARPSRNKNEAVGDLPESPGPVLRHMEARTLRGRQA